MLPVTFADAEMQSIQNGLSGIRENDLNKILPALDILDARIEQITGDIESFTDDTIILNLTRLRDLYIAFRNLLQVYSIYLQQTNGITPYSTWLTSANSLSPFNGRTPKTYIDSLQPLWYHQVDDDGDGVGDRIVPDTNAQGITLNWSNSPQPLASFYRTLRGSVGGTIGGGGTGGGGTAGFNPPPQSAANQNVVMKGTFPPGCIPKFSFRITQTTDPLLPSTKQFYGFVVKREPRLEITMCGACPNSTPTQLYTITIPSNIFFKTSANSDGDLFIEPKDSTRKSVGKIVYGYYYDFRKIIQEIKNQVNLLQLPTNETIYQNIKAQIEEMDLLPMVGTYAPDMGSRPGLKRQDSFYKAGITPSGFIIGLPTSVKNEPITPNITWYDEAVKIIPFGSQPPTGTMTIIENFVYMGGTDYGSIKYDDFKLITTLKQDLPSTDLPDTGITTLINSRITGEQEIKLSQQGSTGGTGGTGGINDPIIIGGDEYGETIDTKNPYYGKITWKFKKGKFQGDCIGPFHEGNGSSGFSWEILADSEKPMGRIYPAAIQSLITESAGGVISGPILDILRGSRSSTQFNLLIQNGLTPVPVSTPQSTTIPNRPCLKGMQSQFQWAIKRDKIIPYKLICRDNTGKINEINYRIPGSEANKYMTSFIARMGADNSIFPSAKASSGQLLTTSDGYFYTLESENVRVGLETDSTLTFSSFTNLSRANGPACVPNKTVESNWVIDLDNPCGCEEVEILNHYLVYPEIKYENPLYGTTETFPELKVPDDSYPAPLPGSKEYEQYRLSVGQQLTSNRREKIDCFEGTGEGKQHHPFLYGTDILPGIRKKSIKGLFNLSQSLECYHTSSLQNAASKDYYYQVTDCDNCERTAYFAVAYGHKNGSGSISSGYESNDSPSRAIYSQYRLLALDSHETNFTFYDGGDVNTPDDIYVINYYRNGLSDKLDIGNFEINIAELSGSGKVNIEHTGSKVQVSSSNKILTLIDNSAIFDSPDVCANDDPNYYYDIVSGSLSAGIHSTGQGTVLTNTNWTTYGKVYPNLGVIVLDGHKLNVSASFNSVTGSNMSGDNSYKLFTAISGAAVLSKPMRARNVRFKTTNHYFVRVPSSQANYSNNPTYIIESGVNRGKLRNTCFVDNPITYITTVGLYNSKKELIAVAKLSKPIKKSRENDVLIKIRLNW